MLKKFFFWLVFLFLFWGSFPRPVFSSSIERLVTIVNPVRSRIFWKEKNIGTLKKHAEISQNSGFSASWLLQYDALQDDEVIKEMKELKEKGDEIGVFLEVSERLATDADVPYLVGNGDYFRSDKLYSNN